MPLLVLKNLQLFFLFLVVALILRLFSFYPFVIDHDESTYLVIADAILKGKVYLVDVIDTKPIGIFWFYALILNVFGKSIIATRIVACVVIALSSLLIYLLQMNWTRNKTVAILSGLLYIAVLSVFKRWGLSPNTEIYFNLFNLLFIYLSLAFKNKFLYVFAGFCAGIAFQIKYVAIADSAALMLYFSIISLTERRFFRFIVDRLLLIAFGFILPTFLILYYYRHHSALDEFLFYTFRVGGHYASSFNLIRTLTFLADFFLRFLPVSVLLYFTYRSIEFRKHPVRLFLILWFAFDLCIILFPGKYFEHYFIQIVPVYCILAGFFFNTVYATFAYPLIRTIQTKMVLAILVSFLLFAHYNSFIKKPEPLREIHVALTNQLKPNDIIYTANANHILYFLLDKESPSPYIHSSLLWNENHRKTLEINGLLEIENIRAKHPDYILWNETSQDSDMQKLLLKDYTNIYSINNRLILYKRPDSSR